VLDIAGLSAAEANRDAFHAHFLFQCHST
jgi:hypothetical protein